MTSSFLRGVLFCAAVAGLAAGGKDLLQRHGGIEDDIEEADHHLVPALVAPEDIFRRIGIEGVVGRVVEVRGAIDAGTFGQRDRLAQFVPKLPGGPVVGNLQERASLAAGVHDAVLEILAAAVHVRMQAVQCDVVAQFERRIHPMVGVAGRNFELAVGRGHGEDALGGRLFGEDQADAAAVRARLSVGGVVDLQNDVGAGADELGLSRLELFGRLAGRIAHQKIAGQFAGIDGFVGLGFFGDEGDSGFGVLQPVGPRLADEGDDVVDAGAVGGPRFRELNPLVGLERRGDQDVLIFDGAGGGDFVSGGQFDDGVGFGNGPAIGELARRRQVFGIALGRSGVDPGGEGIDFLRLQGIVVGELAVVRIGEPGRHFAREHGLFDGLGPGAGLLVGEQGKRRGLTGTVADLAAVLQDGRDVLREGRALRETVQTRRRWRASVQAAGERS